jgi:SPP1 gp7 family putative phage head morphogenesis protein
MVQTVNERFMDFQVAQQIRWIRLQNRDVKEALLILNSVDKDLKAALSNADLNEGTFTTARLQALKAQVEDLIVTMHNRLAPVLTQNMIEAAVVAGEIEAGLFSRVLPAGLDVTTPNLGVLQQAATLKPFNGGVMDDWTEQLKSSDLRRTWGTILDGITSGETTDRLIREVIGTKSLNYKDGVRQVTRRGAEALVRTSINHATNQGRQMVWEANSNVIAGVRWTATLDGRTSPICQHRDGRVGPVVDTPGWEPPNGALKLEPPFARPPAHPNCRSTTTAVTKSWQQLGFNVDEMPPGTRASMDGKVPADLTYSQWLKRASVKTQKEAMGPTRWDMWKKDGVNPDKFINDKGRLLTIREVKALGRTNPLDKVVYQKDGHDFIATPIPHAGKRSLASHEASNAADSKVWEAFRDEIVEMDRIEAGIKMVNIDELKTFQSTVFAPTDEFSVASAPVHVLRYKNQLYLKNGNHRVTDALRQGESRIEARIVDLKPEVKK